MRKICMSGSMSGVGKRSQGRTSEAPPDERGGNRYVRPTATAPHLDSTELSRSAAVIQWQHLALGANPARRSPHSHPPSTGTGAASARQCSRSGSVGDSAPRHTAGLWAAPAVGVGRRAAGPGPHRGTRRSRPPNSTACRSAFQRASSVNDDWETGVLRTILLGGAIG
jgi:hypothetical protein